MQELKLKNSSLKLAEFFSKNFPNALESNFAWDTVDSITLIEIIVKLENHYQISIFPTDLYESFQSIDTIEKMIEERINSNPKKQK